MHEAGDRISVFGRETHYDSGIRAGAMRQIGRDPILPPLGTTGKLLMIDEWVIEAVGAQPLLQLRRCRVTNGDVFEWRSVWPALAETLGVDVGADKPTRLATYIRDNADVWARVVAKHGLASGDLRSFIGQAFAYGASAGPVAFVSTIKLRKAGFNAAVDTRDALRGALQSFIDRKLLPPARN
jgi:hypothetical protein